MVAVTVKQTLETTVAKIDSRRAGVMWPALRKKKYFHYVSYKPAERFPQPPLTLSLIHISLFIACEQFLFDLL